MVSAMTLQHKSSKKLFNAKSANLLSCFNRSISCRNHVNFATRGEIWARINHK